MGASKKAARQLFKKGADGKSVVLALRQKSTGRGHNDIFVYKIVQRMVKPTPAYVKMTGISPKSKIAQKDSKKLKHVKAEDVKQGNLY